jgi:hypothetical protein
VVVVTFFVRGLHRGHARGREEAPDTRVADITRWL